MYNCTRNDDFKKDLKEMEEKVLRMTNIIETFTLVGSFPDLSKD